GANPTLGFSLESAGTDYSLDQECDREFERTRRSLETIGEDEFPDYRHESKFKSRFPQLRNNEHPTWNVNTTSTGMKSFGTFGKTQQQSSPAFQARKTVLRQSNDYLTPSVDYSGPRSTSTRRRLNMSCATATVFIGERKYRFWLDQESDRESHRTLTRYTDAEFLEDSLIIGSLDTDAGELVTTSANIDVVDIHESPSSDNNDVAHSIPRLLTTPNSEVLPPPVEFSTVNVVAEVIENPLHNESTGRGDGGLSTAPVNSRSLPISSPEVQPPAEEFSTSNVVAESLLQVMRRQIYLRIPFVSDLMTAIIKIILELQGLPPRDALKMILSSLIQIVNKMMMKTSAAAAVE
ncbi:hypothetical protein KQX54_001485, partial [Cotesia glomerata]